MSDVVGCHVVEDMGYDSDAHRDFLRSQNNIPVIPGRKNWKVKIVYDKAISECTNPALYIPPESHHPPLPNISTKNQMWQGNSHTNFVHDEH